MSEDYWKDWDENWAKLFEQVEKATARFLAKREHWALVKFRWDSPEYLLSGPIREGLWGNIHVLLLPESSRFSFTYAIWRDEDLPVQGGLRVFKRNWSTSDDMNGNIYLKLSPASLEIENILTDIWSKLEYLSKAQKFRTTDVKLPL